MANIRIKDLASFSGDPSGSDYLAIDSSGETKKIAGNKFALNSKTSLNVTELGSTADLNTYIGNAKTGFYYVTTGVANAPATYCALIVIAKNDTTYQLCFNSNRLYWRQYLQSSSSWSEWRFIGNPIAPGLSVSDFIVLEEGWQMTISRYSISGSIISLELLFTPPEAIASDGIVKVGTVKEDYRPVAMAPLGGGSFIGYIWNDGDFRVRNITNGALSNQQRVGLTYMISK